MNPELRPPSSVREAGSPSEYAGLTSRSVRLSHILASSLTAIARETRARATGCQGALPHERRDRPGGRDVGRLREAPGTDEAERRERAHELRAVDEREPLLRLKAQRLQPNARVRICTGEHLPVDVRLAFAHERKREMREWREVP